jgi:hypothetical protein
MKNVDWVKVKVVSFGFILITNLKNIQGFFPKIWNSLLWATPDLD